MSDNGKQSGDQGPSTVEESAIYYDTARDAHNPSLRVERARRLMREPMTARPLSTSPEDD